MKRRSLIIAILVVLCVIPMAMASRSPSPSPIIDTASYGKASWYWRFSPGINRRTANNELFNDQDMTCAMWDIDFGRYVRVTNLENGKSVVVRVNDRGPHRRYVAKGRIIDLTQAAFLQIAPTHKGLVDVKVEIL